MRVSAVVVVACCAVSCQLPRRQPVTPQRPTVSFDSSTTAKGTLEVEAGVTVDPQTSFDSPTTLKFGATDDDEFYLGLSPYQRFEMAGGDESGSSDLVLGARHRLWRAADGWPAAALHVAAKLPTASTASGLSSGETDVRLGAAVTGELGPVGWNAFYQYGALGDPEGDTVSEHTGTLTASVSVAADLGAFAELAAVHVPRRSVDSLFVVAGMTWAAERWLVFDGGCVVGVSRDAPDLQLFVGLTHNFGAPRGPR